MHLNIKMGLYIIIFDLNNIMYFSVPVTEKEKKVDMIHHRPATQRSLPSSKKSSSLALLAMEK